MEGQNKMKETNNLFPIFLKLENFRVLIVGGGKVALEKLNAVLQNSPTTSIKIVSKEFDEEIKSLKRQHANIELIEKEYEKSDFDNIDFVIAAVNDLELSKVIYNDAKSKKILANVADKPELCDFYLGAIVKKGNLKIAISTNGKSPTIARRLKEAFNELLPDELDELLDNMNAIRKELKFDFAAKIKKLNEITEVLVSKQEN